jgi:deoxyribonuclease-4
MFGSHLSIAGNLSNALREAETLGLDTVQVFTKNQQQWKAPPLKEETIEEWQRELARLGWARTKSAAARTVSHASYLINLASPDDELWRKSVDLMLEEIRRCEALGIGYLVHHPGAYTTATLDAGLERIADAYAELFDKTAGFRTVSCLENTAGGGSTIGREFEDLVRLRELIIKKVGRAGGSRVAYCFDTCHAHAAGYDMSSREAASATLDTFDRVCGLDHMAVLHLNDSKGKLGSRLDRHEHIGDGEIGLEGFGAVLTHPTLRATPRPMIMETPKGQTDTGIAWDTLNLDKLRKFLAAPSVKTTTRATPARRSTRTR